MATGSGLRGAKLVSAVLVGVLAGTTGELGAAGASGRAPAASAGASVAALPAWAASAAAASAAGASAAAPSSAANVATHPTVSIVAVSPQVPVPIGPTQKLKITVRISNPTIATVDHLQLQVNRGDPITSEAGVAAAITTPPPATDLNLAAVKVPGALTPQGQRVIVLTVTAGFEPATGLCLACAGSGIYPVDVTLRSSAGTNVSRAHTLVPAFTTAPQPVRVSWVWPLIDRPHRTTSDSVFEDDSLATSVASGGRLDRALRVAELVKNKVHLTLVVDPELIDALSVMTHSYTVRTKTTQTAGTGGPAAAAWLKRLRAVAGYDDVSLTGYADPDVDALVRAGVEYSTAPRTAGLPGVAAVLGAHLSSNLAWPPGENLDQRRPGRGGRLRGHVRSAQRHRPAGRVGPVGHARRGFLAALGHRHRRRPGAQLGPATHGSGRHGAQRHGGGLPPARGSARRCVRWPTRPCRTTPCWRPPATSTRSRRWPPAPCSPSPTRRGPRTSASVPPWPR